MSLAKDGTYADTNNDGKVNVGDRINYTFNVTNTGNVTLTNVMVTDNNAVVTGGPIASLAVGASNNTEFTAYHVLTQADINNGGVYNVATVTAKDPKDKTITATSTDPSPLAPGDPNQPVTPPVPACPTCTITPITQSGSMTVTKDGVYADTNGDGKVNVGDRINYAFNVVNTGNVTLTNVTITDNNAVVAGGPITLAVGANDNTTFTAYHVLTQADINNGGVYNVATVTGKDPKDKTITATSTDPTPLAPGDPTNPITPPVPACPTCTITPIVQTGSMTLSKDGAYSDTNADGKINVGDRINYTFVLTNTGNVPLTNVTISDANAVLAGGPIASLAVGAVDNSTFTGYHVLTQADIDNRGVYNTATATGKDPRNTTITTTSTDPTPLAPTDPNYPLNPPVPACPTCTITPLPQGASISVTKDGTYADANGDGKVNVGDRINYAFSVTNTGNVTLTNVTITDNNAVMSGGPIPSLAVGATNTSTFTAYHVLTQADLDNSGVYNTATVTAKDPSNNTISGTSTDPTPLAPADPNYPITPPVPACPTCTITPIVQLGSMKLTKDGNHEDTNGDGKVNIGDRVNYTFVVTNTGNVTLTNVMVTDPNAVMNGGPIPTLAVGASNSTTFTAYHLITQADLDNGGVFNLATVTAKDPKNKTITTTSIDPSPLSPIDPNYPINPPVPACPTCTISPLPQAPAIRLIKTGVYVDSNGDGITNIGDQISYSFKVENTGNVTVKDIKITDQKVVVTGGPITLAPGASDAATFKALYNITQADINAGGVYNIATATGQNPKGGPVTDQSENGNPTGPTTPPVDPSCPTCTITPLVPTPVGSIRLIKTGTYADTNGDGKVSLGDRINYTFSVQNTGAITVFDIRITDPKVTVTGGPITLAAGAIDNATFKAAYNLTQADIDKGAVYNLATATGRDADGKPVSDDSENGNGVPGGPGSPPIDPSCPSCTINPLPRSGAMRLTKTGSYIDANGDGRANVGDRIDYTFKVENIGSVTLTGITVTDIKATVTGGPINLIAGAVDNTTFKATYLLTQADIDKGAVYNIATAAGKDPQNNTITDQSESGNSTPGGPGAPPVDPNCTTCTITPLTPAGSLRLIKTSTYVDFNGDGRTNVGDRINYSFSVQNTGNVTLTNITVTDNKVAVTGGPITLAPGAVDNTTFRAVYTITQADMDKGAVYNVANTTGRDPQNNPVTDQSESGNPPSSGPGAPPVDPTCPTCTITPLTQDGKIVLVKKGTFVDSNGDGFVQVGEKMTYTFTVTNTGTVPITGLVINDAKIGAVNLPLNPSTLAPGAVGVATGEYSITRADIDLGRVINTATASGKDPNGKDVSDVSGNAADNNNPTENVLPTQIGTVDVPNILTPNGDGKNDIFIIIGRENYESLELEVFNRWGNQVYMNRNYKSDWRGEGLNEGTYFYTVKLKRGKAVTIQKGWVLIKR
ncbi:MAG: DUF7507 domain-containing protein [Bacteroidia bacterium]